MGYYILASVAIVFIVYVIMFCQRVNSKKLEINNFQFELSDIIDKQLILVVPLSRILLVYFPSEKEVLNNAVNIKKECQSSSDILLKLSYCMQINYIFDHLFILEDKYTKLTDAEDYKSLKEKFVDNTEKIEFSKEFYEDLVHNYNDFIFFGPNIFISILLNIKKI